MNRRPTIKDVAKAAEVSIGTVSKVINNDPTVHTAIRKAVEAAIAELGYRPSALARSFQSGKSKAIGFVVGDLSIESYLSAIPLAQEEARKRGYTLIVADSRLNRETEQENINMMMDLRVEGLLWRPVFPFDLKVDGKQIVLVLGDVDPARLAGNAADDAGSYETHAMLAQPATFVSWSANPRSTGASYTGLTSIMSSTSTLPAAMSPTSSCNVPVRPSTRATCDG